jgi:hypothetical protein
LVVSVFLLGGCWDEVSPPPLPQAEQGLAASSSGDGDGSSSGAVVHESGEPAATSTGGETDDPALDDASFTVEPDLGARGEGCDTFAQDCPSGQKCVPYANDGGSTVNATRCVDIHPQAVGQGEACWTGNTPSSGHTGVDNCDFGMVCWDVDPETNIGLCLQLCEGTGEHMYCSDPDMACVGKEVNVCFPKCRPLEDNCPAGCGCYAVSNNLACAPDASGDMGAYGDPCEFVNVCDPGNVCLGAEAIPACAEGSPGCCTEFCDLTAPACPDAELGVECVPWYEEGQAPPENENLGVCVLPEAFG